MCGVCLDAQNITKSYRRGKFKPDKHGVTAKYDGAFVSALIVESVREVRQSVCLT